MAPVIGICDDSAEQVELLAKYLNAYPGSDGFETLQSTQPRSFLEALTTRQPHLVFLDIDMGELDGIHLGDGIKALYPDTVLVYITAHEKYAVEAFRVRAFHYLLKPVKKEAFFRVMDEALKHIQRSRADGVGKSFSVQTKGEIVCLPYDDIFYFEKVGHRIKIHTAARDIHYYGNLHELPRQLDTATFLQCHQGYIVNMDKIRSFREKTLYLEGNLDLPVSRSYAEAVREALEKRLFLGRNVK